MKSAVEDKTGSEQSPFPVFVNTPREIKSFLADYKTGCPSSVFFRAA